MKIENPSTYSTIMGRYTLILIAAFAFSLVAKPETWEISLLLFAIIELLILSNKFTQSIHITPTKLIITYFIFFKRKELKVSIEDLELVLVKNATFRSHEYFLLKVLLKGRKVYIIDSRDGFQEKDLTLVMERSVPSTY